MVAQSWKIETARDFIALGSWIFYALLIAGIILLILGLVYRKYNSYLARGLVLVVFTILFYDSLIYTYFASVVLIGLVVCSYYLDKGWKKGAIGILIGVLASVIAYFSVSMFT